MDEPGYTVLLVDDSLKILGAIKRMLTEILPVKIIGMASTVREAMEMVENLHPRIVILDINLPDGSGLKVLEKINESTSPPRTVILTNSTSPMMRRKCLQLGAADFLDKTLEFNRLPEVIRQLDFHRS